MNRILVTGGAGFIGSNFIEYVLRKIEDVAVVNLDALTYAGCLSNLEKLPDPSRHTFIEGDICDQDLVRSILLQHKVTTVVHFAAESHVDRSIIGPAPFIRTNINGTFSLLEAVREANVERGPISREQIRFHHVSTDEVYGSLESEDPAFTEENPYLPNSPYAASKAASDHLVRAYAHTYQLPITISNCSNNYGPYQFPEKLIPLMILNAIEGINLPIYGDGQQVRDWLYVEDHCDAILQVLNSGTIGETYNIGGDNQWTNLETVKLLCSILDERLPDSQYHPFEDLISFVDDRPGHDRRYAMNISKMKTELGWSPKESFETGLSRTVEWYLSNEEWLEAISQRPSYEEWMANNYGGRGGSE